MESIREGIDLVNIKLIKDKRLVYKENLSTPIAAVNAMYDFMQDLDREVVVVINLDAKFKPINANIVSIGDMKSSVANIGMMVKTSILSNAVNIISIHNHPSSGDPNPSYEDKKVFRNFKRVLEKTGSLDEVLEMLSPRFDPLAHTDLTLFDTVKVHDNKIPKIAMKRLKIPEEFKKIIIQEKKSCYQQKVSSKKGRRSP